MLLAHYTELRKPSAYWQTATNESFSVTSVSTVVTSYQYGMSHQNGHFSSGLCPLNIYELVDANSTDRTISFSISNLTKSNMTRPTVS